MAKFAWQNGYGAFSVNKSGEKQLMQYINNQQQQHKKLTFKEEYVAFLKKHGVEFEEKYLWD